MNIIHKEFKFIKKNWGVGVRSGGIDGWTDEHAQTNLPFQLLRSWGHNNALMCKLCP